jgi:hypothetical protein
MMRPELATVPGIEDSLWQDQRGGRERTIDLGLKCPYCRCCAGCLHVLPGEVTARPVGGRCAHLAYLEGQFARWRSSAGSAWQVESACSFAWYHPRFETVDRQGVLRHGFLTGMVNLYPSREAFRLAEPFEVTALALGRSRGQPGADYDLHTCALFAPDPLPCLRSLLAVNARQRGR